MVRPPRTSRPPPQSPPLSLVATGAPSPFTLLAFVTLACVQDGDAYGHSFHGGFRAPPPAPGGFYGQPPPPDFHQPRFDGPDFRGRCVLTCVGLVLRFVCSMSNASTDHGAKVAAVATTDSVARARHSAAAAAAAVRPEATHGGRTVHRASGSATTSLRHRKSTTKRRTRSNPWTRTRCL